MPFDIIDRIVRPLRRGPVTRRYPDEPAVTAPALRGLPVVDAERCDSSATCVDVCPTGAIALDPGSWAVDTGRCVFCGVCETACPRDAIHLGPRFELAARSRADLRIVTPLGASK